MIFLFLTEVYFYEGKHDINCIEFSEVGKKNIQNCSHGWSDNAYANVVNGEVQVAAEDPLTGGSPSIHGTTRSKLVEGEDTTMSRFGH